MSKMWKTLFMFLNFIVVCNTETMPSLINADKFKVEVFDSGALNKTYFSNQVEENLTLQSLLKVSATFGDAVVANITLGIISSNSMGSISFGINGSTSKWNFNLKEKCDDHYIRRQHFSYTQCVLSGKETNILMNMTYLFVQEKLFWWETFSEYELIIEGLINVKITNISVFGWDIPSNKCNCFYPGVKDSSAPCDEQNKCICKVGFNSDRCVPCETNPPFIYPSYGPISKPQIISLSDCIDFTNVTNITIGSTACRDPGDNYKNYPSLYPNGSDVSEMLRHFLTPVFSQTDLDKNLPIQVCWTTQCLVLDDIYFSPKPDPQIVSIKPNKTIVSGGLQVTIGGTDLSSYPAPLLNVIMTRPSLNDTFISSASLQNLSKKICTLIDEQTLICYSPDLRRIADSFNSLFKYFYTLNLLKLSEKFPIALCTDPEIPNMDPYTQNYESNKYVNILNGVFLNCCEEKDYEVTVGDVPAEKVSFIYNTLAFFPPSPKPPKSSSDQNGASQVKVSIGSLSLVVGYIQYEPPVNVAAIAGGVLGSLGCIAVILIIISIIYCVKRHNPDDPIPPPPLIRLIDVLKDPLKAGVVRCQGDEKLLRTKFEISRGNFGLVYYGEYKEKEVAVKTLLEAQRASMDQKIQFLKEAVVMMDFNHPNVLSLIAIIIDQTDNPKVVLPYMKNGDLRTYLLDAQSSLDTKRLLDFAKQIATGMEYLASKDFVHRDLAARNCMIDKNLVVKVADFGLARDIYDQVYYTVENKEIPLPYKWMPMECLDGKLQFSQKTDVWSFGILMWEVFTKGESPYFGMKHSELKRYLHESQRLHKPLLSTKKLYNIMLRCWSEDPHSRPKFSELMIILDDASLLNEDDMRQSIYENLNKPSQPAAVNYLTPTYDNRLSGSSSVVKEID